MLEHPDLLRARTGQRASLATIYGVQLWRRTPVLIVEYFPLGTLAQRLRRGPVAPAEVLSLGVALARALVYMHARGVLHRDIKPSNIAFTATGLPKLLDFGLAQLTQPAFATEAGRTSARYAALAGTPAYLPPEVRDDEAPGVHYDLWALSVVLREAVTGMKPFTDGVRPLATVCQTPGARDDASSVEAIAPALNDVLTRALHPIRAQRFPTAAALLEALEAISAPTR